MVLSFMRDSVTIVRAELKKKNGAEIRDWENAEEHTISNVQITSQSTSTDFEGRTSQASDVRTFRAGFDADIEKGDRVIWGEATYVVDGEIFRTKSPTGRVSTTRCRLVRWEG